ncbi:hypothetical protein [Anabaena sp. UHCC 0399]|uniref:hypothetical protein n=1 Tax=Anabaena sp. UHCC 0399 TaxID=3110238 RepID=UPI002B1F0845|nr:hypothetical protein [Anabaena sp. UHCC 0399]MEA5565545.1 hypothetical protein [Anabaena sp. UHCC 0399]
MKEGWHWLQYQKSRRILSQDKIHQEWADVWINFSTIDGMRSGKYEVKPEISGSVMCCLLCGVALSQN